MQQVGQREVSELQTQLTDDTGLSPTGREFHLVVSFGYQIVTYIYSSVFRSWLNIRFDLFRVKVSHLLDFTHRTHQVFTAEQVTRTGTEFTAYYVFVQTVVTIDADLINGRKAYLQAELSEALQSLKKQKEKRARFITLDVKEQQIVLPVKEIVYIESQAHYLLFHVMNSEREEQVVRSRGKISDYAEKMLIFHFLRPGKSYLVNSMWIQNFNLKEITVKTGQHIPVSRDKKEEVKKQYFGYMRSRIYEMD